MNVLLITLLVSACIVVSLAGLAIAFGGPAEPRPMDSIGAPFKAVDYSGLPDLQRYRARDGSALAYRTYMSGEHDRKGSVVLVHGSSASSQSMHVMASAFAAAGYVACALDVRGHGESGNKGRIDYVGQLEDDLEDFVRVVAPPQPVTLAGFSSGGGFVLRVAGSPLRALFSGYLLLSPFISQDARSQRPNSGGWVSVGLPRYIALGVLNAAGVRAFNALPVTRFALDEASKAQLTASYSFPLAQNFRPQQDYRANIRNTADVPLSVLAGENDEAFHADRFAEVFSSAGRDVPVVLIPGLGHIALTLDPVAVKAAVNAVDSMTASAPVAREAG
ncbi:alpha/beta hydrolase [Parazoarcus communis]|uniref:Alpha/beta hydrolase n=1 Tax=Parazoarcus communis TaxID=41977 RepID=A0A2U8H697_9RHOO|nr:alpha/beta hydrolase [Parazoarcus communis]AWI81183.1 alpha/beta hydrolase [Parazoarcus communis]